MNRNERDAARMRGMVFSFTLMTRVLGFVAFVLGLVLWFFPDHQEHIHDMVVGGEFHIGLRDSCPHVSCVRSRE